MEAKNLTSTIAVSPQIMVTDVAAIAKAGFRSIVCNRPDGEGAEQPSFGDIEKAAKQFGLKAHYQPVVSGKVRDEDARDFSAILDDLPEPVLVYCRSGKRSATLWALSEGDKRALVDILARTKAAGYDMSAFVERISGNAKKESPNDVT